MKPLRLLASCMVLVSPFVHLTAQDNVKKTPSGQSSPFAKGKNAFTIQRNISYRDLNSYVDGDKTGSDNRLRLGFDYKRFVTDGFAVGVDFDADFSGSHAGNTDQLYREWSLTGTLTYGTTLGGGFNLYGEAGVGFGYSTDIYKTPSTTDKVKDDIFGFGIKVGAPIAMFGSNAYLTPSIRWRNYTVNFDDGKQTTNEFNVGLHLESYLFCREMTCDRKLKDSYASSNYDQGSSYIGYYSKGGFGFGTYTTEYDLFPGEDKENFSEGDLKLDYMYYILDNVAVGAGISFMNDVQKSDDNDYKYTRTRFSFMPQVVAHVPAEGPLRNVFLQLEGNIGSDKYKNTIGSVSNTQKYGLSGFKGGLGYNCFFNRNLAFTTIAGYQLRTTKDKDNDDKIKDRGFFVQGGIRVFF